MILTIDQGNTCIKVAVFESDEIIDTLITENLSEEIFLDFIKNKNFSKIIYSSVAKMPDFLADFCKNKAQNIKSFVKTSNGVNKIGEIYDFYDNLGADLLSSAIFAKKLSKLKSSLTISLGSCLTGIVVASDGRFAGGTISPGMQMRFNALNKFTAMLPLIEVQTTENISTNFAKETVPAITNGVLNGIKGEINEMIFNFQKMFPDGNIYITGGNANLFKIDGAINIDNIVMRGLNEVARNSMGFPLSRE
jgi:type III pantothenate kinase